MSRPDAAALLPLAESIADGGAVDWEAAEASATAERARRHPSTARVCRIWRRCIAACRAASLVVAADLAEAGASPAIGSWAHLTLLERLGGGTFGDVYRAWDRHLEREVALKLLQRRRAGRRSARVADRRGRPAACARPSSERGDRARRGRSTSSASASGWSWCVARRSSSGCRSTVRSSAREAALVGIDLCRALAAIHAAGPDSSRRQGAERHARGRRPHRPDGSRHRTRGRSRAAVGRCHDLAGTPLYLAPEIFDGAPASERTDLYSLGVLLYHLVTGSFPVRATTIDELQARHRDGTGVRLRDAQSGSADRVRAGRSTRRSRPIHPGATRAPARSKPISSRRSTDDAGQSGPPTAAGRRPARRCASLLGVVAVLRRSLPPPRCGIHRRGRALRRVASRQARCEPIRSIAVLPLANLSGDPSQEYFADGMTDEMIGTLGQLGGLDVISRTSTMQFKGSKKPLPEIARALHVDAVLEGSVLGRLGDARTRSRPGRSGCASTPG